MPKDSTVADLDNLHRQARRARARLEPEWYLCLAYYYGQQWVAWDGRQLHRPSLRRNRITVVDNRIQGCIRTEIAKMTKTRPVFTCTPRTGDEADANAARLSEMVMRFLWTHLNLNDTTMKALLWSRIAGSGFLKVYWDSTIGDGCDCLVGPNGNVLTDAQGKPMKSGQIDPDQLGMTMGLPQGALKVKSIAQGDLRVEARSPFQIFPDPLADQFSEVEWVIEESVKSKEYVQRRYNVALEPDTPANPGLIEARMGQVFMPGTGGYKGIKVREYWCKPCTEHPKGRRVVWAVQGSGTDSNQGRTPKGQILEEVDNPFDAMPYVMLSGIPVPGRFWPTSIAEQLRGPQTELNKVKSQLAENRNRVGNPTVIASKQAVQDPEKFTDSMTMPGGIYFFDDVGSPNNLPQYLQAPSLPQYVTDEVTRIEESIQEISGQHEVSSAQVPPGVTAASAINLLQEADDTRLGPAITDYEYQLSQLGQKILKHVGQFYTDARTIRLAGDNGAWEIFDFRGAMMRDHTEVEVQAGSAFPQSKAAKQAALQDLLTFFVQSGNAPKGRQLAQFLRDWEVGGVDRLIEDYTVDETQVNRENILLSQGQEMPINDYDNDEAHIEAHTDFQKQQRYQQLQPQIKQIFEQHVLLHRNRLKQQQELQMQMMAGQHPAQQPPGQSQQGQPDPDQQQAQADAAAQQQEGQAQQQGYDAAGKEQQQRHAEEQHQQRMRHAEEMHQQKMRQVGHQEQQQRLQAEQQMVLKQQQAEQQAKQQAQQSRQSQQQKPLQGGQGARR